MDQKSDLVDYFHEHILAGCPRSFTSAGIRDRTDGSPHREAVRACGSDRAVRYNRTIFFLPIWVDEESEVAIPIRVGMRNRTG
jgi:hypothetical protein